MKGLAAILVLSGTVAMLGPPPSEAAHGPAEARFLVGTNLIGYNFMSCQGWTGIEEWGVNGGCKLTVPRLPHGTIYVRDITGDSVGFHWYGSTRATIGFWCASGQAFGQATIFLDGCDHVTVAPDLGSVGGWIRVV